MAPESCVDRSPSETEGAGKAGRWPRPWPASKKKSWRQSPQVWPRRPGPPCAMVLTLIARSPWRPGFLASIACIVRHDASLASASGGQDHTPSRPYRDRSSARKTRCDPIRPSHPAPNVRDDREAPLIECGTARIMLLIRGRRQEFFCISEYTFCDTMARRAICAWRACANRPSCVRSKRRQRRTGPARTSEGFLLRPARRLQAEPGHHRRRPYGRGRQIPSKMVTSETFASSPKSRRNAAAPISKGTPLRPAAQ